MKNKNPLLDEEFLLKLESNRSREIYARITTLTIDEKPIEYIEGKVTSGQINIDGSSAVRRSCSLSLTAKDLNINEFYWGLKSKFTLEIGLKNNIDATYEDIIWFKQGIYVISGFSCAQSTNNYTVNINGKDKMCLLNGDIGGTITDISVDFGTYDYYDKTTGVTTNYDIPIETILHNGVRTYANELPQNVIINDVAECGMNLLEYRGDIPIYMLKDINQQYFSQITLDDVGCKEVYVTENGDIIDAENSQVSSLSSIGSYGSYDNNYQGALSDIYTPTKIQLIDGTDTVYTVYKIEKGMTPGYELTDLTYAGDLIASAGDSFTSVLDKIVEMLGNFEYFYDLDGKFVFQKKKNYLTSNWTGLSDDGDSIYIESAVNDDTFSYNFKDGELISQFNNSPNFGNVKNDFVVWGQRTSSSGAEIPIHMRVAIDKKPTYYKSMKRTNKKNNTEESTIYTSDKYDWRELIYQMAIDWNNANNDISKDTFYITLSKNNTIDGEPLYPNGVTGYERYYTDMEGFWRQLYDPISSSPADKDYDVPDDSKTYYFYEETTDASGTKLDTQDSFVAQNFKSIFKLNEVDSDADYYDESYNKYVNYDEDTIYYSQSSLDLSSYSAQDCFYLNDNDEYVQVSGSALTADGEDTDGNENYGKQYYRKDVINRTITTFEEGQEYQITDTVGNTIQKVLFPELNNNYDQSAGVSVNKYYLAQFDEDGEIIDLINGSITKPESKTDDDGNIIQQKNVYYATNFEPSYLYAKDETEALADTFGYSIYTTADDFDMDYLYDSLGLIINDVNNDAILEQDEFEKLVQKLVGPITIYSDYAYYITSNSTIETFFIPQYKRIILDTENNTAKQENISENNEIIEKITEDMASFENVIGTIYNYLNDVDIGYDEQHYSPDYINSIESDNGYIVKVLDTFNRENYSTLDKALSLIKLFVKQAEALSDEDSAEDYWNAAKAACRLWAIINYNNYIAAKELLNNYTTLSEETCSTEDGCEEVLAGLLNVCNNEINDLNNSNSELNRNLDTIKYYYKYADEENCLYTDLFGIGNKYYLYLQQQNVDNGKQYILNSNIFEQVNVLKTFEYFKTYYTADYNIPDGYNIEFESWLAENYPDYDDLSDEDQTAIKVEFLNDNDMMAEIEYNKYNIYDYSQDEDYYTSNDYSPKTHWAYQVLESPELINFWFDFVEADGTDIERYSIPAIGDRPKVVNETSIKSIYYRDIPNVLFNSNTDDYSVQTGYVYATIPDSMANLFTLSGQGTSAHDKIDTLLNNYTYAAESVSITAVPIYRLDVNTKISIIDNNSGINGEYIIEKITLPLTYNGMMSISATKVVESIT